MAETGSNRSQTSVLALLLVVLMAMSSCGTSATTSKCPLGYELSGDKCTRLYTQCEVATLNVTSSWVTLAQGKLSRRSAVYACSDRGFNLMDYATYNNTNYKVQACVDKLLTRMMNSGNYGSSGTLALWTSYQSHRKLFTYHYPSKALSSDISGVKYTLCSATWKFHTNTTMGWAAAIINNGSRYQAPQFAKDTCQSIGYEFLSVQELYEWRDKLTDLITLLGTSSSYGGHFIAEGKVARFDEHYRTLIIGGVRQPELPVVCFKFCKNSPTHFYKLTASGNCIKSGLHTHCKLANIKQNLMSSWIAPVNEGNMLRVTAKQICQQRGFDSMDFVTYVNPSYKVRPCVDKLFKAMINGGYYGNSGSVAVWTAYQTQDGYVKYQYSSDSDSVSYSSYSRAYSMCSATWKFHTNVAMGWSAAIIANGARLQNAVFAKENCQSIGYEFLSVQELVEWRNKLTDLITLLGISPVNDGYIIANGLLARFDEERDLIISDFKDSEHPVVCLKLCNNATHFYQMTASGNCISTGLYTHCKAANLTSSWIALGIQGTLSRMEANNACSQRGFNLMDFNTYTNLKVRPCVDKLFKAMINSGHYGRSGTVAVWTAYQFYGKYVSYQYSPASPSVSYGTGGAKYGLCSATWKFHTNVEMGWSAAIIANGARSQKQVFAEENCQSIGYIGSLGYKFISVQELNDWKYMLTDLIKLLGVSPLNEGFIIAEGKLARFDEGKNLIIGDFKDSEHPVVCLKLCKDLPTASCMMTASGDCYCQERRIFAEVERYGDNYHEVINFKALARLKDPQVFTTKQEVSPGGPEVFTSRHAELVREDQLEYLIRAKHPDHIAKTECIDGEMHFRIRLIYPKFTGRTFTFDQANSLCHDHTLYLGHQKYIGNCVIPLLKRMGGGFAWLADNNGETAQMVSSSGVYLTVDKEEMKADSLICVGEYYQDHKTYYYI